MFEHLMTLVFLAPVAPSATWSAGGGGVTQAGPTPIRLEVSGPSRAGCVSSALTLPPSSGGTLRFEQAGVRYVGSETATGSLTLRSDASRPLTLSGSRTQGGLWSLGTDGRCVGTWRYDHTQNAARR